MGLTKVNKFQDKFAISEAVKKNLKVAVGLHRRHQPVYRQTIERVRQGAVGEVMLMRCYWNLGFLNVVARKPGMTEMEYQMRNSYYFTWLSGDHPNDDEFAVVVAAVRKVLDNPGMLGARPKDLASVLARLSLAAPGNCAYRAMRRTLGAGLPETALRSAAFRIARGFQGLFNHGDAAAAASPNRAR